MELPVWRLRIVVLIIAVLWKIFFCFISLRVAPGTIMQEAARCWLVLYLCVHRYLLALIPNTGWPPETLVRVEMRLMHRHTLLLLLLLWLLLLLLLLMLTLCLTRAVPVQGVSIRETGVVLHNLWALRRMVTLKKRNSH